MNIKNKKISGKILSELYISFFKIGALTFGGGLAMLPMLKRELVDSKKWVTEEEILDMYAIGQCTPGFDSEEFHQSSGCTARAGGNPHYGLCPDASDGSYYGPKRCKR